MQNEVGKKIGEYLKRLRKPKSAIDSFRHHPSSMIRNE